ncbi:MAG: PocR ligand-binding domain-containing protein [Nitrospirota bacterium]
MIKKSSVKWKNHNEVYPCQEEETLFPRIIDSFQKAMRLKVHVIPVEKDEKIRMTNEGGWHPFCELIQSYFPGKKHCVKEITRAARIAAKIGEPYIFQCHADMIEFAAATLNEDQKTFVFICGPVLLRHPDSFFVNDILAKIQCLSINPLLLTKIILEIPVFSERRVQAAADLLFMIANYFSRMDSTSQKQKYEINRQQSILAEELFMIKKSENDLKKLRSGNLYFGEDFYKEKELIDLIKFGERKKAKAILDELLGVSLFRSHEYIGILKARILEIIAIIARAAVESGANLEEVLGFKYQFIQNLANDNSQENFYYTLRKAFDQIFECIYQNRNIQHTRVFTKVKEYIWNNYNQNISLQKLAEAVGISSYYLSHLFRKEMGISFLEYLTSVRIAVAKSLLKQATMTVLDVCLEVGYQDPSYFAKVFTKKEGVHPSEYRKLLNLQAAEHSSDRI